jgi:hypothetical protein
MSIILGTCRKSRGPDECIQPTRGGGRARTDSELDDAFTTQGADALLVNPVPPFFSSNKRIVELAQRRSMPVMYPYPDNVVEGGLIGYGPIWAIKKEFMRARILKGEKPPSDSWAHCPARREETPGTPQLGALEPRATTALASRIALPSSAVFSNAVSSPKCNSAA